MIIRQATINDHQGVIKYALKLVHQHHNFNPLRFVEFANHEQQLFDFFAAEIINPKAVVLVVEVEDEIVGYSFTRLEESSLVDIAPESVWLHDIYIDESARGMGAGKLLLNASIEAAKKLGSQILILQVAAQNEFAKQLFEANGFNVATYEMMMNFNEG
ncbi:GNAT family N-acetyltransferase [Trichormus variabilis]|uniref:Acetyltransferase n=1 Tax=Trichormus variabilis SAG 1403-4b TaxID=447716 RepID=A0A433UK37_ANAVA|nr:GNAT family N-acetyltransferase [Trichormus variabilis]MBD2628800.1 GNAT family N-acetyltransferase [Trichormus variabilis FACHB-164]RUS94129.1 acetyltransferase [Trichormus variabilis SAG 1403-4b]